MALPFLIQECSISVTKGKLGKELNLVGKDLEKLVDSVLKSVLCEETIREKADKIRADLIEKFKSSEHLKSTKQNVRAERTQNSLIILVMQFLHECPS